MLILLIIFYYVVFLAYFQNDEETDHEEQMKKPRIKQSTSTGLTKSIFSKDYPNKDPTNSSKTLTLVPTSLLAKSQTNKVILVDEDKQKNPNKLDKLDVVAIKNIPIKKVSMTKSNLALETNKFTESNPDKNVSLKVASKTRSSEVNKTSKMSTGKSNEIIPIKNTFSKEVSKGKLIQVAIDPNLNSKILLTKKSISLADDKCVSTKILSKEKSFGVIKAKSILLNSMETAKSNIKLVKIVDNEPKSRLKTSSNPKDNLNIKPNLNEVFALEKSPPKLILKSKSNFKKSLNTSKSLTQLSFNKRTRFKNNNGSRLSANSKENFNLKK